MTIAVTGACGYVGSMVCLELFRKGYSVLGIDNLLWGQHRVVNTLRSASAKFSFLQKDIWDIASHDLAHCHTIIHLAALVGQPLCDARGEAQTQFVNTTSTRNLVKLLSPSQRFLYANSNSGYGHVGDVLCDETSPLTPLGTYARSKAKGEEIVLEHPDSASLRLATVFGTSPRVRMDLLVNNFSHQLVRYRDGTQMEPLRVFEPLYWRSGVHVRDVARAFSHFCENDGLKGVFNVANPQCEFTKGVLAGRLVDILHAPPDAIENGQGTDPDQRNYRVCSAKLLQNGFSYHFELKDGAREIDELVQLYSSREDSLAMFTWRNR